MISSGPQESRKLGELRPEFLAGLKFPAPFRPTAAEHLNLRVAYTSDDATRARAAVGCHASQFTPQTTDLLSSLAQKINNNVAYLRRWNGGRRVRTSSHGKSPVLLKSLGSAAADQTIVRRKPETRRVEGEGGRKVRTP